MEGAIGALLLMVSLAIHARGALDQATWSWNSSPTSIDDSQERLWTWTYSQPLTGIFPPPLAAGDRLQMGQSAADPFLVSGWAMGEGGHRWNDGTRARIQWMSVAEKGIGRLVLRGFPLQVPGAPDTQRLRLILNGQTVFEGAFTGEAAALLPPGLLRRWNTLDLEFPDAVRPADLGMANEDRTLAIGFTEVALE